MVDVRVPGTLDFRPPVASARRTPGPLETVGFPGASRLAIRGGDAYAVGASTCMRATPGFAIAATGVTGLSPAVVGAPLLRRSDGSVARVAGPGMAMEEVASAPRDTDLLVGLEDPETFLAGNHDRAVTWLSAAGRRVWERSDAPTPMLFSGGLVLRLHPRAVDVVDAVGLATGAQAWSAALGAPASLLAVVDGVLWTAVAAGRILGLDAASGARVHDVAVPAWVPTGPVDDRGVLHVVTAERWTGLDLVDGGAVVFDRPLAVDARGAACATGDGELIAAGHDGRVHRLPSDGAEAVPLLDTGSTVRGVAVADVGVVVLAARRVLARWWA